MSTFEQGRITIELKKGISEKLYVEIEATAGDQRSVAVIAGGHTSFVYLQQGDEVLLDSRDQGCAEEENDGCIRLDPFVLNTRKRTLEKNGQRVKLTQVEYSIMKMFMENPGKALSREEILKCVWGENYLGELKIVDVNIRRLRIKIEDDTSNPTYITTVWGYGYKWGG